MRDTRACIKWKELVFIANKRFHLSLKQNLIYSVTGVYSKLQ